MTDPIVPPRRTTWTPAQNVARVLWATIGRLLWTLLPAARPALLRAFGAKVGPGCRFARTVSVYIPWNVTIGRDVRIEDGAAIYSLGRIEIGDGCFLDRRVHLCAGTHDMSDPAFPLVTPPIALGPGCRLGFDVFVAPGTTLGAGTVALPRASIHRSFPGEGAVLAGNPARPEAAS